MSSPILFLDLTTSHSVVPLPPEWEGSLATLTLVNWAFHGIPFTYDGVGRLTGPTYAQLRLHNMRTHLISSSFLSDTCPIPLLTYDGWNNPVTAFDIPVGETDLPRRLTVDVYADGPSPAALQFTRCLLWFRVTFKQ